MTRGIWRYLEKLPPIDWAYIASLRPGRHGRFKKTPEQAAKTWKTRRARAKVRQRAAVVAAKQRWRESRKGLREQFITARIIGAMEPGEWYGASDVRILSGLKRGSVYARLRALRQAGVVEKAANPDYVLRTTPQWLYRLTPAGEAERARTAYLL